MKDPLYERLCEISWRRKLTPQEQTQLSEWLAAHPEAQDDWESEAKLNQALASLANVPVATNFTARVLDAAKCEVAAAERRQRQERYHWRLGWLPKAALATVVLAAGLLSYHHVQETRHQEVLHSLATISQLPSVPSAEVLKDFDAIAAIGSAPLADEELLNVMQ